MECYEVSRRKILISRDYVNESRPREKKVVRAPRVDSEGIRREYDSVRGVGGNLDVIV